MSALWLALASGLVMYWARLYTAGASAEARDARRAEIASDLWEHGAFAARAGERPVDTAREVFGRFLRGVPADLAWRLQLKGEPAMPSKIAIERSAGLLSLLVVGLLLLGIMGGRFGIGADEPYFTYDFPDFARNLAPFGFSLVVMAIAALVIIAAAAALHVTFRPHEPVLATIGAFGLVAAGVLLLVTTGAGRALYGLADEWRQSGKMFDAVWSAARAVALVFEHLAFVSFGLILASVLAFGLLILRRGALPRWIGGLAAASAGMLLLGVVDVGRLVGLDEVGFRMAMTGGLLGLLWLAVTGAWLTLRGTREAPR